MCDWGQPRKLVNDRNYTHTQRQRQTHTYIAELLVQQKEPGDKLTCSVCDVSLENNALSRAADIRRTGCTPGPLWMLHTWDLGLTQRRCVGCNPFRMFMEQA